MSLFTPGQVVKRKTWFSASVTGTPTAQLYVNNVATGSAVNGTGSGAEWSFAITLPSGASASDSIQIIATATVDSWTERNELVEGSIATVTTKAEIRDSILDRVLSGNHDTTGTVGEVLQELTVIGNGTGMFSVPLTIKLDNGTAVADCEVIVTSGSSSSSDGIVGSDRSDSSGDVSFDLDEDTYYIWRQKSGINFTNPKTLKVASDGTPTIT